jgi:hypothetical protein
MRACLVRIIEHNHWLERSPDRQKIGERGLDQCQGRANFQRQRVLANREELNHMTNRICAKCGEAIMLKELQPVKVVGKGMVFYHKAHYNVQ